MKYILGRALLFSSIFLSSCNSTPKVKSEEISKEALSPPKVTTIERISNYRLPEEIFDSMHKSYVIHKNDCDDLAQQVRDILEMNGVSPRFMRLPRATEKGDLGRSHMWLEQQLLNPDGKTSSWYIIDPAQGKDYYYASEGSHSEKFRIEKIFTGDSLYIDEPLPKGVIPTESTVGYIRRYQFYHDWLNLISKKK